MFSRFGTRAFRSVAAVQSRKLCSEIKAIPIVAKEAAAKGAASTTTPSEKPNRFKKNLAKRQATDGASAAREEGAEADSKLKGVNSAGKPAVAKQSSPTLPKSATTWVHLSGFSEFSSRRDLQLVLGSFKPSEIEPCLLRNHQFSGVYALNFESREKAAEFIAYIKSQQRPTDNAVAVTHDTRWIYKNMVKASRAKVGHNTLRIDPSGQRLFLHQLLTSFENYGVCADDIVTISNDSKFSHYLVHFPSVQDAQRAYVEFDKKVLGQSAINITAYQC